MRLRQYYSALVPIRGGGPRYDEARRDYQEALRAQFALPVRSDRR